jgi:hypothetical protein
MQGGKNMRIFRVCGVLLLLLISVSAYADPTQWSGNGHWYELVIDPNAISWDSANAAAAALGGHLATITSAEENAFVYSLISDYSGDPIWPWLGAFQPSGSSEPAGGWQWVTGEPFVYANWIPGEPNDHMGIEDWIEFSRSGDSAGQWNDNPGGGLAYFLEIDARVPEPSSLILLGSSLCIIGLAAWRMRN